MGCRHIIPARFPFPAILILVSLTGCGLFDAHINQMDTIQGMATQASTRLSDGSIAQMSVSGQAINPGVTVEAGVIYRARAFYEGLGGQFSASAQGQLGNLSPQDQAMVEKIMRDKSLSDEQRIAALLVIVGKAVPSTQPVE